MGFVPLLQWKSKFVLSLLVLGEWREEAQVCLAGQDTLALRRATPSVCF